MIHNRTMFGTESSGFRSCDYRCWDSAGGLSGTNLPGIVIEALANVGPHDGRRRCSVAGRRQALEVVGRIVEVVARGSHTMGREEGSGTRALELCSLAMQYALPGPLPG